MNRAAIGVLACACAAALAPVPPTAVERYYSRGFYAALQPAVTALSSLVPFALLDVAVIASFALVTALAVAGFRRHGFRRGARRFAWSALVAAAVIYLWFLVAWGFNYRRVPLEAQLAYDPSRVTRARAVAFGRDAVARLNAMKEAGTDREPFEWRALEAAFASAGRALGTTGGVRLAAPKRSLITWYFSRAAIDGMTDPFFLEIILNTELLPFERPFVLAHEWAHLAGYADESDANYIAWLTCITGPPAVQYSGWLAAYELVTAVLPPDDRRALRDLLSPSVRADLAQVAARLLRADPIVRTAAREAYDTYLRANRVDEGIASYGAAVRLMLGGPSFVPSPF